MIDIHAHILPGVDDGPADWQESLAMIEMATKDGISDIVATPHVFPDGPFNADRDEILSLVDQLQKKIDKAGLKCTIYPGSEIYLTPDIPARVKKKEILTYCDAGKYILIEMPSSQIPSYTEKVLFELQLQGLTPIIAHPERNLAVIRDPARIEAFIEKKVPIQITANSLKGTLPVRRAVEYFLNKNLASFVATDAHGSEIRRPLFSKYIKVIDDRYGTDMTNNLCNTNPSLLIANEEIKLTTVDDDSIYKNGYRKTHFIYYLRRKLMNFIKAKED